MPGPAPLAQAPQARSDTTYDARLSLWPQLALASLAAFIAMTVLVHLLRPDLDPVRHQMSLYLIGPWGHLLQTAYGLLSLGMLALAYGLRLGLQPRGRSVVPPLLLAVAAIALCVTAYAWMDMPDAPVTLQGQVHVYAATTAFLSASVGIIWQALCFRHDRYWRRHLGWALPWAIACFAALWLLGLCPESMIGLGQKSVLAMLLGWLGAVSLCQLWQGRQAPTAAD